MKITNLTQNKFFSYFVISISGILLGLSFPKFDFYFLSFISFLILFYFLPKRNPIILGIVWGFSYFFVLLYWLVSTIEIFSNIPLFFSFIIVCVLCFYLSFFLQVCFLLRKKPGFLKVQTF